MKIRLTDLSSQGLSIDQTISKDALNARLREGRECDITFIDPPRVQMLVVPTARGAQTKGTVTARYRQACGACSDPVERSLEVEANFILEQKPADAAGTAGDEDLDDVGISFFEGDSFDLEDLIQEDLILGLSLYWHPPRNERGDCEVCGRNVARELKGHVDAPTRLGELLDAAKKVRKA
jgi:uncharacterized metal-binding protein YceD (DUF177 family)